MTAGLHLILGGQRSGKSRAAEEAARNWLERSAGHEALFIATAQDTAGEMAQRIARHRADRARTLPAAATLECPLALDEAVRTQSSPQRLLVIDCLTLWLVNALMPPPPHNALTESAWLDLQARTLDALRAAPGPVVLVSNEIGLGVVPLAAPVRAYVDALGRLNQAMAAQAQRVTLMVAGCALTLR
ncbi:bifunctional adenosylcobinamide kinase/adenosylcobinamide-phosphate guanylyltransferase [Amphibiibacter pelophylacis]|uniref:Bifunctional adenosylcobinamide kinase/adenosylcobinamide-phosphate guanylyltransferase n=1 Tax=Amphibiibacter pelophylacis TaxID=1799477 RepID=A0ACC6P338_9BURK